MNKTWHQNAIALSGIIGSGKSRVAQILSQLGAYVLSADQVAREVVEPGQPALEKIRAEFGAEVCTKDGHLDRSRMAELIFGDPEKRKKLESITHPVIATRSQEHFTLAMQQGFPLYVYEVPLLFESGLNKKSWQAVVVVSAPKQECIKRIMQRDGLTEEKATLRFESQIPLEQKIRAADIVIENDSDIKTLEKRTEQAFKKLTARS